MTVVVASSAEQASLARANAWPQSGARDLGPAREKPRLLVFIHGWRGNADASSWGSFPDLVRADPELSTLYHVVMFQYPTAASSFGKSTPVPKAAELLREKFDGDWRDYP